MQNIHLFMIAVFSVSSLFFFYKDLELFSSICRKTDEDFDRYQELNKQKNMKNQLWVYCLSLDEFQKDSDHLYNLDFRRTWFVEWTRSSSKPICKFSMNII